MVLAIVLIAGLLVAVLLSAFASERATRWRLDRALSDIADARTRQIDADDARERMRSALDAIPDGVVLVDERGVERFRNQFARGFVGGRHAEALVEQAIQEVLASALQGTPQRVEVDVLGPPKRALVVSAHGLGVGSARTGAVAIVEDVSERRHLDAVRRDFVANISHELKTPVGALGLLAETIAAEDDPAVMHRLADRMTAEAHRVGRIIEDLLALSRIEGVEQIDAEPVAIADVIRASIERVAGYAEAHRMTIVVDADAALTVRADRRQLVSAIANLLENACNYSDDGSPVYVTSSVHGSWVEISVRDEGVGIPSTDLDRVFERFYRVDRSRRRETGGTGLGLAIVRHVATNHHGDVRVESREGEGSTFTISLPT
jgi:two-component system sensor histidine kinase SenX3